MQVTDDNYQDLTVEDVEGAVASVKFGYDEEAARNLIHYFHFMLRDGGLFCSTHLNPKERLFIEFVEHAFARMTEKGKTAEIAFGLELGRGEYQRKDTTERDVEAAAVVILLRRNGWPRTDAVEEAANIDPEWPEGEWVAGACRKYEEELSRLSDTSLLEMIPEELRSKFKTKQKNTKQIKRNSKGGVLNP